MISRPPVRQAFIRNHGTARKGLVCLVAAALYASGYARAQSPTAVAAQVERGAKIYQQWCSECHNVRGFATVSLKRRYQGLVPAILDERRDLNSALIHHVVRNGMSFMPFFRKTEITDQELAVLTAYLTADPALRPRAH